ncbi:MAG: transketolase, partial [Synergistaceae bacterium]|jgi:transketolase|nr:transketolase [Synergistaceae bacterium]
VFEYGRIDALRSGGDVTILAMGHLAVSAVKAADLLAAKGVGAQVLHASSPLGMSPEDFLSQVGVKPLVTCEDHHADTGLGASAALMLARAGRAVKMKNLGVSRYGESGPAGEVIARMGLSPEGIAEAAESLL